MQTMRDRGSSKDQRIAEAVARGDEEAAVREMATHLDEIDAAVLRSESAHYGRGSPFAS